MPEASTEILVIGGGVIGSAIAYQLARAGHSALVPDQQTPAAPPAASWASAGGVRRQGRHAAEALLAQQAIEHWPALGDELGADLHYRHAHSPYVGRALCGRVVRTLVRGTTVWHDGRFVGEPVGRLVRPSGQLVA